VHKLFAEVAPRFKDRPGGYARIIKIGPRPGDAAEMVYLELVDEEYVAKQREERTPEVVAAEPAAAGPVEAAEEAPETEAEAVEEPTDEVEEPTDAEPVAAEAEPEGADDPSAEGDEPAAADETA